MLPIMSAPPFQPTPPSLAITDINPIALTPVEDEIYTPTYVKMAPPAESGTEAKIKKQGTFKKIMKNMYGKSNEYN